MRKLLAVSGHTSMLDRRANARSLRLPFAPTQFRHILGEPTHIGDPDYAMTDLAEQTVDSDSAACGLTVFHDGSCALCRREIALVQGMTAHSDIAFVDVSGRHGDAAPGLTTEAAMRRFHVRRADGTLLSGARAFIELWSVTPRFAWVKALARWPLVVRVLDGLYSGVLIIRPPLSRAVQRFDTWRGK